MSIHATNTAIRASLLRRMMATANQSSPKAAHGHAHKPGSDLMWKRIFFFVCIPAILLSAVNTYLAEKEHHAHFERPEFRPMEYMYVRKKPFPWGDGNHTLFHNPKVNALPTGYEEMPEEHGKKH